MFLVVGELKSPPTIGFVERPPHRVGHPVCIHDDRSVDISGCPTDRLHQARLRAEEPFLVGVEDGYQRNLWKIEALAQQVDADQNVVLAQSQISENLHPLQSVDLAVQIPCPHPHFEQVVGEILGHLLGEGGHQNPLIVGGPFLHIPHEIVDLAFGRADDHLWIDESGRSDDLLDDGCGLATLPVARGGGQQYRLAGLAVPLLEVEGAVVDRRGKTEPVGDQHVLSGSVSCVLAVNLGDGDMALVDHREVVVREVIEKRVGRLPFFSTVEIPRVVLDPRAEANLAHHLHVVGRAHAKPLRLEMLALFIQIGEPIGKLDLDLAERPLHPRSRGDVVTGRVYPQLAELIDDLPGDRVHLQDPLDLIPEVLDAKDRLLI